jgi:hypothetical protein
MVYGLGVLHNMIDKLKRGMQYYYYLAGVFGRTKNRIKQKLTKTNR